MEIRDGMTCIIVNYKSLDYLKSCLESLLNQEGVDREIVVVDNNSSDGTGDFLKGKDIKYIPLDKNHGFGAAVNRGAVDAQYKYLFILNPDTVIPADALKRLHRFAEEKSEFGLIAPALEYPDGRPQLSARSLPGRRDFLLGRGSPLFKLGVSGEKKAGYILPSGETPREVPAVSATAILLKTTLFKELGGFDERFFMYLEDIDLCRRIGERGLPVIYLPGIKIGHSWRRSSTRRPYFTSFHHHISVLKYFLKYDKKSIVQNLFLSIALAAGFIFSAIFIFIKRSRGNE
jgi:GT2 family glycosyltransferase